MSPNRSNNPSIFCQQKYSKGLSFPCHISKGRDLGASLLQCNFNYQGPNPREGKSAALVLSVIEMFAFTFKMHFLDCSWTFYRMTVLKWTVCKVRSRRLSICINVCHTPFCTWRAVHAHSQKWSSGNIKLRGVPEGQMKKCPQGCYRRSQG